MTAPHMLQSAVLRSITNDYFSIASIRLSFECACSASDGIRDLILDIVLGPGIVDHWLFPCLS